MLMMNKRSLLVNLGQEFVKPLDDYSRDSYQKKVYKHYKLRIGFGKVEKILVLEEIQFGTSIKLNGKIALNMNINHGVS